MNKVFLSVDANDIGKKLEQFILNGQLEDLRIFSKKLTCCVSEIGKLIASLNGEIYMQGGDNILASLDYSYRFSIISQINILNQNEEFTFSIGMGSTPANAYLAIKYAKANKFKAVSYFGETFERIEENIVEYI